METFEDARSSDLNPESLFLHDVSWPSPWVSFIALRTSDILCYIGEGGSFLLEQKIIEFQSVLYCAGVWADPRLADQPSSRHLHPVPRPPQLRRQPSHLLPLLGWLWQMFTPPLLLHLLHRRGELQHVLVRADQLLLPPLLLHLLLPHPTSAHHGHLGSHHCCSEVLTKSSSIVFCVRSNKSRYESLLTVTIFICAWDPYKCSSSNKCKECCLKPRSQWSDWPFSRNNVWSKFSVTNKETRCWSKKFRLFKI